MQTLTIREEGDIDVIPAKRNFLVKFKDITDGKITVYIDDVKAKLEEMLTDCTAAKIVVEPNKTYKLVVKYKEKTSL